jgi:ABC-type lipoprotein export system ATPase subunit
MGWLTATGLVCLLMTLRRLRERGTTVVLVIHDARVAAYADREVIVRDGKVSTFTGPSRDLPRAAPGGQRGAGRRSPAW